MQVRDGQGRNHRDLVNRGLGVRVPPSAPPRSCPKALSSAAVEATKQWWADVARGRRLTSWPSVRTDLRNAGAEVVDEQVVTDGNITTSRSPEDLPDLTELEAPERWLDRVPAR